MDAREPAGGAADRTPGQIPPRRGSRIERPGVTFVVMHTAPHDTRTTAGWLDGWRRALSARVSRAAGRDAWLLMFAGAVALSACVGVPRRTTQAPTPSPEDGVVINTDRSPDDALYQAYRAMVTAGLSVDSARSGSRRLQARPWAIAGDTSLTVDVSVIETQSPQAPTVIVLSARWSSSSARVSRRLVTSQDAARPWAVFQRLGESVREMLRR